MQPLSRLQQMLQRVGLITSNGQHTSVIHFTAKIRVALAAFIALFLIAWVSLQVAAQTGAVFLLASMGASAVILFALPASPLAKPWNFIAGHLIPACIGLACAHLFTDIALMAATTIALVLFSMYIFECMHPPGGATALVPVIAAQTGQVPDLTFFALPCPAESEHYGHCSLSAAPLALGPRRRAPGNSPGHPSGTSRTGRHHRSTQQHGHSARYRRRTTAGVIRKIKVLRAASDAGFCWSDEKIASLHHHNR